MADRCEIQVSYAIGVAEPTSIHIETLVPEKLVMKKSFNWFANILNCAHMALFKCLDLLRPIYRATAAYGHFGREEPGFYWEKTDKAEYT